jgi:cysteinyl-tRNA synthetase
MKLYNTLGKKIDEVAPLNDMVRLYSCGPTVYDHIHIGNLSSFIYADTLRRVLGNAGYTIKHVMNFTDVDDKTIARSRERYPDAEPKEALKKLTDEYEEIFLKDMASIGNDISVLTFVKATKSIEKMQELITKLHSGGFAYITDDGVYFSIEKYRTSGKIYGQLTPITEGNTSEARIQNDEYDKESAHDFALWKTQKGNEPAWEYTLDGQDLAGRPGWHIECSAMSETELGIPFDIHTGGVDLIFPHHENEIAQSTAGRENPLFAKVFFHNEHMLVEGKKMSKSLQNFFTLADIQEKGIDPLAFRIMVLQSHYRSQSNFTWENLEAAQAVLQSFNTWADLQFQNLQSEKLAASYKEALKAITAELDDDIKTPAAFAVMHGMVKRIEELGIDSTAIAHAAQTIDEVFGLRLSKRKDIDSRQAKLLQERIQARENKDWVKSDELRDTLKKQGIGVRDTPQGQVWERL